MIKDTPKTDKTRCNNEQLMGNNNSSFKNDEF